MSIISVNVEYAQEEGKMIITHPLMTGELVFPCASEEACKTMIEALSNSTIQGVLSTRGSDPIETILGSIGEIKASVNSIAKSFKKS